MLKCPTCGHPLPAPPTVGSGGDLANRMRSGGTACYQGRDGLYYLERGGGQVSRAAIDDALKKKLIVPRWDDAPDLQYWRAAPNG